MSGYGSDLIIFLIDLEPIVNEETRTVKKNPQTVENVASSNLNPIDQNTTTISSNRTGEIDSLITSTDVKPYVGQLTSNNMISIPIISIVLLKIH